LGGPLFYQQGCAHGAKGATEAAPFAKKYCNVKPKPIVLSAEFISLSRG